MAMSSGAIPVDRSVTPKKRTLAQLIQHESRRRRTRRIIAALLLAVIPLVAIAVWIAVRPKPAPMAARFRTAPATQGDVVREVHATGHLEAITTVQVGAEISGRIASVDVDHNDRVKAGQILARFDRASLEAQLAQSEATFLAARAALEQAKTDRDRAQRDRERVERLFGTKSVSETERDNAVATARLMDQRVSAAEAQLAAQKASKTLGKTNLEHTIIRAPIDGVVITRNVDPGQTVAAMLQTPVLFTWPPTCARCTSSRPSTRPTSARSP
jgi:HlyD family secretion protein